MSDVATLAATLGAAALSGAAAVTAAVISARAGRSARAAVAIGSANANRIDQVHEAVRDLSDPKQTAMIRQAVELVAHEHPNLVTEALADELVRTVLQALLDSHDRRSEQP